MSSLTRNRHRRMMLLRGKGSTVLEDAEAYWDARFYDGGTSLLDMKGRHPAQLGSTAGADSNDPLFLPFAGTPYLYLPGVTGNYANVPDEAALDITGDIDLRATVALTSWVTGTQTFIAKRSNGGSDQAYRFHVITSTGRLQLLWTPAGPGSEITATSTVSPTVAEGGLLLVRATLDVDNGASGYTVQFFTKTSTPSAARADLLDHTGWSQLGADVVGGAPTSIYSSVQHLAVGSLSSGGVNALLGVVYGAAIYNGIAGTKVFDVDFTALGSYNAARTSLTAVTGQTVTVNRSATGRKSVVVERNVFLLGVDDYFEVADSDGLDFGVADSFTVVIAARQYGTPSGNNTLIAKKPGELASDVGWQYYLPSGGANSASRLGDGSTAKFATTGDLTRGTTYVFCFVRAAGATLTSYLSGVAGTGQTDTLGTFTNTDALRIGRLSGGGTAYGEFEFFGAAIFRRALTDAEIIRLNVEWAF